LYGRGGADDGYAIFAALGAIKGLQTQGVSHARFLFLKIYFFVIIDQFILIFKKKK